MACNSGCGKSCTGNMENYCNIGGTCQGACHNTCTGGCTGTCSGTCQGGCSGTCNDTCKGSCTGCSGCGKGCAGACSSEATYQILAAQFNDIAQSRGKSNRVSADDNINVSEYNALASTSINAGTEIAKSHANNMTGGGWTVTLP